MSSINRGWIPLICAIFLFAAQPSDAIIFPDGGGIARSYLCRQPVEVPMELRSKLLNGGKISSAKPLSGWDRPLPLSIRIQTFEASSSSGTLFFVDRVGQRRQIDLYGMTIPAWMSQRLDRQLAIESRRIEDIENILLKVGQSYQVLVPDLAEELTEDNFQAIWTKKADLETIISDLPKEKAKELLQKQWTRYQQDPVTILAWDQLDKALPEGGPFNRLLRNSFTAFQGNSALILVSRSLRQMAVCFRHDDPPATAEEARAELQKWMNSRFVRSLLACEEMLKR